MELLWENGEVVIRGPSSSTRTTQPSSTRTSIRKFGDVKTNDNTNDSNSKTLYSTSSLNKTKISMKKDLKVSTSHGSCLLVESSTINCTHGQPALLPDPIYSRLLDAKNDPPPDQESNALVPLAESSKCSRGASNNPNTTAMRNYRRTEDQPGYCSTDEDQSENVNKSAPARGKICAKRKRIAKEHRLSEKRRRDEINKRLQTLQELIPNCRKVDKASVLDEAIEYLKTLQLQLQMMSVSAGPYMPSPSPMMLSSGFMQQLHPSNLPYCPMMDTVRAMMMAGAVATNLRDRFNLHVGGVPSSVSPAVPMTMLPPGIQSVTSFPPQPTAVTNPVNMGSNVPENIHK